MKKKAAYKDFYMEIKKSPGRFLSILFIVALGVAFFSGIRASEPDMRITGDSYFDASSLMDIQALSTYGVTREDIQAFENLEEIEKAEGAYSGDFLNRREDEQYVVHVMSLQTEMNKITVSEGRLPESIGECLADDESVYEIGDEIPLTSGTEDPVSDTLKTDTLKVVGRGNSPCYLSYGRGSATIGNGSISAFLVVTEDSFNLDVYSEVYLQVRGAAALTVFTDAYDDKIEKALKKAEDLADDRGIIRKAEIVDEANEELEDAKKELQDAKKETSEKLEDAKKEIEDGESQLKDAKKQIEDGRTQIAEAKKTLTSKQKELDQGEKEYEDGKKKIEEGKKEYQEGLKEYNEQKKQADQKIKEGKQQLAALEQQISADERTYSELQSAIKQVNRQLEELRAALETNPGDGESADEGDTGEETPVEEQSEEQSGESEIEEQIRQLTVQLEQLEKQAGGMQQKITAEQQGYQTAKTEISSAENALKEGEQTLSKSKKELDAGEKKLKKAKEQLISGQKQIDEGWSELKKQEKELDKGAEEIASNEKKLKKARKDYEEGEKEAAEEIEKGEQKIKDAEQEIAEIEDPEWYVYDRNHLVEYTGFGENAERLGAIGRVFPVLFFLVAALISLTSMTRMVEEQRTAIGTMKALGYGKLSIAGKYLGYAFLATLGGSIIGVLIGEKIFPYIIIYAYGILYRHLPEILVPYDWKYAAIASGAGIFCTMFATLCACYKELGAQPAILMRPPAPKNGRRVFLEHIRIVWKHLNFTWKSTIRNLMRYKKRFFMTVFGIGGCMALMLVGFGLKDSCYEIAELQYSEIQLYDASLYLEEDITEEQQKALEQYLSNEKKVTQYMSVDMQAVTLVNGGKEWDVYACTFSDTEPVDQFVDFHDRKTKEKYELSDDGVIISEKSAKLLDAEAGDTIYIKDEDGGNKAVKIEYICENYLGHYMYLSPVYYEKVYGEQAEYNSILFKTCEDVGKDELEEIGQKMMDKEGVLSIGYMHDTEKQLDDMLRSLNLVIIVLIISAGMLAFVVLYNLNTINIAERKRELATLKVLGFYNGEVAQYVYRENVILTFIGAAVGCILGNLLHRFIIETVEVDSAMFGREIHWESYVYSLILTVLFSLLINGVMYFKLKKIDMVESLKSIE